VDNRRWDTTPVVLGLRPMMSPLVEDAIRGSERRAAVVGEVSIGSPTANALPNLLLPGQYHRQDNDGYADPQLE
jgi:hypothetical protein